MPTRISKRLWSMQMWSQGAQYKGNSAQEEMPASHRHMHNPICDSKFTAPEQPESSQGSGAICAVILSERRRHIAQIHLPSWNWRQTTFTPAEMHSRTDTAFHSWNSDVNRKPSMPSAALIRRLIINPRSPVLEGQKGSWSPGQSLKAWIPSWQFWQAGLLLWLDYSWWWGTHYFLRQPVPFFWNIVFNS